LKSLLLEIGLRETTNEAKLLGRATAQAVSRWLPTAAARIRVRVWSSGICGGQSGAGAGFHGVLRFPLPIFIPPNSPLSQSVGAGTIGQKWPTCRVDPVWTPPSTMRIKKLKAKLLLFSSSSGSLSKLPYLRITTSYTVKKYLLISDFPRITSFYFHKYVYILFFPPFF
jgi:hypothetical protein